MVLQVLFAVDLCAPRHSFLWSHIVLGAPIAPAALLLELARAAATACMGLPATPAAASPAAKGSFPQPSAALLLHSLSIPSPVALPAADLSSDSKPASGQQHQPTSSAHLVCSVSAGKGHLEVQSGHQLRTHLAASLSAVPYTAAPPPAQHTPARQLLRQLAAPLLATPALMAAGGKAVASVASSHAEQLLTHPWAPAAPTDQLDAALQLGAVPTTATLTDTSDTTGTNRSSPQDARAPPRPVLRVRVPAAADSYGYGLAPGGWPRPGWPSAAAHQAELSAVAAVAPVRLGQPGHQGQLPPGQGQQPLQPTAAGPGQMDGSAVGAARAAWAAAREDAQTMTVGGYWLGLPGAGVGLRGLQVGCWGGLQGCWWGAGVSFKGCRASPKSPHLGGWGWMG